jgi:hypothetical protein
MNQLALTLPGGKQILENDINIFGNNWNFGVGTGTNQSLLPSNIINTILPYLFVIAGLILLAMLIAGGFTIFVSAGNPEKIKKGTGMITSAIIGFLIMLAAYWIIELLQYTLGFNVLYTNPAAPPSVPCPSCAHPPCPC